MAGSKMTEAQIKQLMIMSETPGGAYTRDKSEFNCRERLRKRGFVKFVHRGYPFYRTGHGPTLAGEIALAETKEQG